MIGYYASTVARLRAAGAELAPVNPVISGLTDSASYTDYAQIGNQANITVSAGENFIQSYSWGQSGEFGSGPNPTDFSALDSGDYADPEMLFVTVTVGGVDYTRSATIRRAAPVKVSDLTPPALTVGQAITPINVESSATGDALSARLSSGDLPAGLSLTDGVITGAPTEVGSVSATFEVYNSGGSVSIDADFTVSEVATTLTADSPKAVSLTAADTAGGTATFTTAERFSTTGTPSTTAYAIEADPTGFLASIDPATGVVTLTDANGYEGSPIIRRTDDAGLGTEAVAFLTVNLDVAGIPVSYLGTFPTIYVIDGDSASYDVSGDFEPSGLTFSSETSVPGISVTSGGQVTISFSAAAVAPVYNVDWTGGESAAQPYHLTATLDAGYAVPAGHEVRVHITQDASAAIPTGSGVVIAPGGTWTANFGRAAGEVWYVALILRRLSDGFYADVSFSTAITIEGPAEGEPDPDPPSSGDLTLAAMKADDVYDVNLGRRGYNDLFVVNMEPLCGIQTGGQDTLYPSGVSDDGTTVTINTGSAGNTVTTTGKTFLNRRVTVTGSGKWVARNCIFGVDTNHNGVHSSGHRHYCNVTHGVGLVDVQLNDFRGIGRFVGENSGFARQASGNTSTATVSGDTILRRNKFVGLPQDAIKPAMTPGTVIEENWIDYTTILHEAGEDPHADAINPAVGKGGYIRRNMVDMRIGASSKANNTIRAMTNTGHTVPFGGFTIEGNVLLKDPADPAKPLQIGPKDTPNYDPIIVVGNRITKSGGEYIHGTANAPMVWMHNIDHWTNREIPASEIDASLSSGSAVESKEPVYIHNTAEVPLSGTSNGGAIIEARAQSQGDGGAKSTAWQRIGTAPGSGNWSGILKVPGSNAAYKVQVREASNPTSIVTSPTQFRTGLNWDTWSQSNGAHAFYPQALFGSTRVPPESVANPNIMWAAHADRSRSEQSPHPASTFKYDRVYNGSGLIAPYARVSNRWNDAFDMALKAGLFMVSGTSLMDDCSDVLRLDNGGNLVGRFWADEVALHNKRGAPPGITTQFMEGGTTSAQCWPAIYGPAWFGEDVNGNPFSAGTYSFSGASETVDNTKAQLYGTDRQKERAIHVFLKPYSGTDASKGRERLKTFKDHPIYAPYIAPLTFQPDIADSTIKGENGGADDTSHVAQDTEYGFIAQAEALMGYTMLSTGSLGNKTNPGLDYVRIPSGYGGQYVAVGWQEATEAGPMCGITTYNRRAGKTRLSGGKYEKADVIFFNGYYAQIKDFTTGNPADYGEIWISKLNGSAFSNAEIRSIPLPPSGMRSRSGTTAEYNNGWHTGHIPAGCLRGIWQPIEFFQDPGPNPIPSDLFTSFENYAYGRNRVRGA